tara:strand:- start:70 stop:522 length:453 start_codon:yes stop_codon:yes gene_type:complete
MKVLDYNKLIPVSYNNKMKTSNINIVLMRIIVFIIIFTVYTMLFSQNEVIHKYSDENVKKDFNILLKCYQNMDYIKYMNYKKEDKTIKFYYKYFNIGNFALTYDEVQHPSYENKKKYNYMKNRLTKYQPCLYIMKSMELSYLKYDIFDKY